MPISDWDERAFRAMDAASGTATVLFDAQMVVRWSSTAWRRIFGFDPVTHPDELIVHPEDQAFVDAHLENWSRFDTPDLATVGRELVAPSAQIRIRHRDGHWLPCLVRMENRIDDEQIGALAVTVVRSLDLEGLPNVLDHIIHHRPLAETMLSIVDYVEEDGFRTNRGPSAVYWQDPDGTHLATQDPPGVVDAMFSAEVLALPLHPEPLTVARVSDMLPGPARTMAEAMGMRCLWIVRIEDVDTDHAQPARMMRWSAYDFALELRPYRHWSIGRDMIRLALNEDRRFRELRERAITDSLTGVLNRAGLGDALDAHAEAGRAGTSAVLFLDIDNFKRVNDRFGHAVGDQVLQSVAMRLRASCRAGDVVSRFGGDEFVIVATEIADQDIDALVERVRTSLAWAAMTDVGAIDVSVSIGVARGTSGDSLSQLLRDADEELYDAKRSPR